MMQIIRICLAGAMLMAASCATVKNFPLVKGGKPASYIVLPDNTGPAEKHAASELALFLEKVTGAKVAVGSAPSKELYNIYLGTTEAKNIPYSIAIDKAVAQVKDDGFVLAADKDGLRIISKKPVGVLYGAYEILKKYADMRWFAPGADFEYISKKKTVSVPEQVTVSNPSFKLRQLAFICANWNSKTIDSWDWMVRNGMNIRMGPMQYKTSDLRIELEKRGAEFVNGGGHVFSTLLSDNLFDEHPEYFPLIDGKRRKQQEKGVPGWPQPCTSNPKVAEIMAESLNKILDVSPDPNGAYTIGNNDDSAWCQCENCVKMDPPEEKERGFVSTRYWTLVNKIAAEVYKTHPDADLWGWGYQNYQYPPTGVVPDPRVTIKFCVHGRCYRHSMADLACGVNDRYRDTLVQWGKLKNTICIFEYLGGDCNFPAYAPIEKSYAEDLKYYKKIGLDGVDIFMVAPDSILVAPWKSPRYQEEMLTEWQMYYIAAMLLWDVDADYDKIYEDIGSKYYGKTWPVMSKYRALLTKTFMETSGHICYPDSEHVIGKCLDKPGVPGVETQLRQLLDEAEKLAGDDQAAIKKIQCDRRYFQLYFVKNHEIYLKQDKPSQVAAGARTGKIIIDGVADEKEWNMADFGHGFVKNGNAKEAAETETDVRVLYDNDNLYIHALAYEPEPGKMKTTAAGKDAAMQGDNSLEFFISNPDLEAGKKYVQLAVNSRGVIYDAMGSSPETMDKSFDSMAEAKTTVGDGFWAVEARIPASALGRPPVTGESWKINAARRRVLKDGTTQLSSWNNGEFHGAQAYRLVSFGDYPIIKNGDFADLVKQDSKPEDKNATNAMAPAVWHKIGAFSMIEGDAASGKYFLRSNSGQTFVFQYLTGLLGLVPTYGIPHVYKGKLRVSAKYRGKGSMEFRMKVYASGYEERFTQKVDFPEWTKLEWVYDAKNNSRAQKHTGVLLLYVFANGKDLDLDDISVTYEK